MVLIHSECYDILDVVDYMKSREYSVQEVQLGNIINFKKRTTEFLYNVQFCKVKDDIYKLNSAYVYTINDGNIDGSKQMNETELKLI